MRNSKKENFIDINLTGFCNSNWFLSLDIFDRKSWLTAIENFWLKVTPSSYDYLHRKKIVDGFFYSNMEIVKRGIGNAISDPILICVMRDEAERVGNFFDYYRALGVDSFVIIENGSTDSTMSLLNKQDGVDIWRTHDCFDARTKVGWINRIIAVYGLNHWYLMVDADEHLAWIGMEGKKLKEMLPVLDMLGINRCRAIMIDMYAKNYYKMGTFQDRIEDLKYFDANSYYHVEREEVYLVCGGPRKRVLNVENWLTKYPLFKLKQEELISNPHTIFPYNNGITPCYFALLHYKFVSQRDIIKLNRAVKEGNYVGGSVEYKKYQKAMKEKSIKFWNIDSLEYVNSKSLKAIKEIDVLDRDVKS